MGVEYQHWLIPKDPAYWPSAGTAMRVHAVLEQWRIAGAHEVHDISKGGLTPVAGALPGIALPETTLITYGDMIEGEPIEGLVGPAADDLGPYLQSRFVVLGSEQHVLDGCEEIFVEVGPEAVETDGFRNGLWTSHWAPDAATRVAARVEAQVPVPSGLTGVFRTAVVLDFGKSVPSFVLNEEERVLADRDFVRAIAEVLEVGFVY